MGFMSELQKEKQTKLYYQSPIIRIVSVFKNQNLIAFSVRGKYNKKQSQFPKNT